MGSISNCKLWIAAILFAISLPAMASHNSVPLSLPVGMAVPILFTHKISAQSSKHGDPVTAKTMQVILNGPVQSIPKGSLVLGHIVDVSYAGKNRNSSLSMMFDRIVDEHTAIPICASARAIVNALEAYQATMEATSLDATASLGTTLVGGDHVRPGDKQVLAPDDDDVGISNRFGIFSRLEPGAPHDASTPESCTGVATLQSVAIFSSRACGLYGFPGTRMRSAGNGEPPGVIQLQSDRFGVEIAPGSAALLQIVNCGKHR